MYHSFTEMFQSKNILFSKKGFDVRQLNEYWTDGKAFILMSAVLFIIATIFKRGIELQSENDLMV